MKIQVRNKCSDFNSYRAARVKSLFNVESGCDFSLDADLPIEGEEWKIGLVVGPSGSGKTSIGRKLFNGAAVVDLDKGWPDDKPIIDAISPGGSFDVATAALAAVGLGSVPAWLRPFPVLSNGEKFRAGLARVLCESPGEVVIDEFTSVVDRQIAKIGALAFQKSWRRTGGKCVLLSCHYDIIDWVEPDWVFDTATGQYSGRGLRKRPSIELEIWRTDWRYWHLFEPHHYLKLPKMVAATCYVGTVDRTPVCHVACSPRLEADAMRACRLVVMPEWQGAGVGLRFLEWVCKNQIEGGSRWGDRVKKVYFHTSHPGLCAALRGRRAWRQVSCSLYGGNKKKSAASIKRASGSGVGIGYGGHFRAVQGFCYGERGA